MHPRKLLIISYLSPNLFWYYQTIARSFSHSCQLEVEIRESPYDPLDDPLLRDDQVDFAFLCGLPLLRHNRRVNHPLQLVAAPIMSADRYQNLPIYFADLVVHADSPLYTFDDLAGARFCYNDSGSNSGYNLLRHRLLQLGRTNGFFASVLPSGSHQQSLQWIVGRLADCATIDSVVLSEQLRQFPELNQSIRVIDSFVSPIPPIVASHRIAVNLMQQLQTTLLQPDAELTAAMIQAQVRSYTLVDEKDYASILLAYEAAIERGYAEIA